MLRLPALRLYVALALLTPMALASDNDPARFAPKDALAYAGIDDLTDFMQKLEQTAIFRLMEDESSNATRELTFLSKLFEEAKKGFAKAIKSEPDKLKNPFGGNVSIFLHGGENDDEPGFVAVLGVKDRATMQGYYSKLTERFKLAADSYERVDFSGAAIDVFTASSQSTPEVDPEELGFDPNSDPFSLSDEAMSQLIDATFGQWFSGETLPSNLAMCLTEEHLYLGQTGEQLKDVIRRGRGADSLTGHEDYKFLQRKFNPLGGVRVFINVPMIVEIATKDGDPKMSKALGLDGFGSLVGHARFGKKGEYESKFEMLQILRGERSGLGKLLSLENEDITPNKAISDEAAMFMSVQMPVAKVFDDIVRIVRQVDPQTAEEMTAGLGEIETPDGKMHMRKDVIDNLRGPLQLMFLSGRPYAPENMRILLTFGHKDQGAMARLLEMMRNVLPVPLTDRDFEGQTLYEAPIGGMALCANSDMMIVGSVPAVEARLRGSASAPLRETKTWRKLSEHLPEKAWMLVYVDARQIFEAGLALASKRDQVMGMAMANPAAVTMLGLAESMTFVPEPDKIAPARKLTKYQAASMMTVSTTPDGLLITQVQLHPEDR